MQEKFMGYCKSGPVNATQPTDSDGLLTCLINDKHGRNSWEGRG
jgi:hypothetical protein